MGQDFQHMQVRSSLVLTDTYVAGTIIEGMNNAGVRKQNQLVLYVDFTKGSLTSLEVKVEFAHELMYDLAYDNQTANYTVGKILTGSTSKDLGVIVADTDSGTTGTLTLKQVKLFSKEGVIGTETILNAFIDNETITDNNSTQGSALVNGTLSLSNYSFFQETASSIASGTSTETVVEHAFTATGKYRIAIPIKDNYIRVSAKGTGTVTSSLCRIEAILGVV